MQIQLLSDSTDTAETRLGGQLLPDFIQHWARQCDDDTTVTSYFGATNWRGVSFTTGVSVTAGQSETPPMSAIHRILSLAIIQHLDGKELESAYEYLLDAYIWWAKPKHQPLLSAPRKTVVSKPAVRRTKARSLDLREA